MAGNYPEIPANAVARFILEAAQRDQIKDVTPMKLLKLVYIAHGWHLGLLNEPLITEHAQAWQYGPVIPSVYHEFKPYGREPVSASTASLLPVPSVDADQIKILDSVWNGYRGFTGGKLSEMTHKEGTPWSKTWNEFGGRDRRGVPIDNMLIRDHYRALLEGLKHGSA